MKEIKELIRNGDVYEYVEGLYDDKEDPYFYDISFCLGESEKAHGIIITGFGVSVDWYGGASTHTNLKPNKIFPGKMKLEEEDLIKIIDLLDKSGYEGMKYTKDEMEGFYQDWIDAGKPGSDKKL